MNRKKVLIVLIAIIGICLITSGVTYALLTYQKEGAKITTMTASNVKLHYEEDSLKKINLNDALPMDDIEGKAQTDYFEFTITGTSAGYDIPYVVTSKVLTEEINKIPSKYITFYLTEVVNNTEEQVLLKTYNNLDNIYKNSHIEQKILSSFIPANTNNFEKVYRLRIWLNNDADFSPVEVNNQYVYPLNGKTFEFKVNVYTEVEGLPAGLYDSNNNLLKTWDELEALGLTKENIEYSYSSSNTRTREGSPYKVFNDNNLSGHLVLPDTITKIGNYSFYMCPGLTGITLPDSVTQIGTSSFEKSNLVEINMSKNLITINSSAFKDSKNLKAIYIPSTVTNISSSVFQGCIGMESVIVDQENKTYDSRDNCNAIITTSDNILRFGFKTTTIPNTVTEIGLGAFREISTLTSITIPNSVKKIMDVAFYKTDLRTIIIPESVTDIYAQAFRANKNLTSVTLPNTLKSIYQSAFTECTSLESITLPESLTRIDSGAFSSTGLTEVYIPKNLSYIDSAFYSCENLQTITVDPLNTTYDSRNNCNAIIETATNILIQGSGSTIIPNDVIEIGNDAFYNNLALTSIYIPNNIKKIGRNAFSNCTNLTNAEFENTSNWIKSTSSTATTGESIDVTNPTTNARNISIVNYYGGYSDRYLINIGE